MATNFFGKKIPRKIDTVPFDTGRVPPKQNLFLMPAFWEISLAMTAGSHLKIRHVNMQGLKPPFIVLGTHHSFLDFYVMQLALFPHRINSVSELEGFEAYGEKLYRQLGCLGTRKFISDMDLVRNIKRVMDRKGILVLYPEARYANVGTSSRLPLSVAKLLKLLKVPVVTVNMKGNYLRAPIWNTAVRKEVRLEACVEQLLCARQVSELSVQEIHAAVGRALSYDEYAWQRDSRMKIEFPLRAQGLHLPLYQCPVCAKEFSMESSGSMLCCTACGERWEMNAYGQLEHDGAKGFSHIPDWYEWERRQVHNQIDAGTYQLDCEVTVEALPNAKNFIDCGTGRLTHGKEGFHLYFKDTLEPSAQDHFFASKSLFSIHTEYDYRGKGQCVTLSTPGNTYFLFPKNPAASSGFNATKIQFAVEYLYGM